MAWPKTHRYGPKPIGIAPNPLARSRKNNSKSNNLLGGKKKYQKICYSKKYQRGLYFWSRSAAAGLKWPGPRKVGPKGAEVKEGKMQGQRGPRPREARHGAKGGWVRGMRSQKGSRPKEAGPNGAGAEGGWAWGQKGSRLREVGPKGVRASDEEGRVLK